MIRAISISAVHKGSPGRERDLTSVPEILSLEVVYLQLAHGQYHGTTYTHTHNDNRKSVVSLRTKRFNKYVHKGKSSQILYR
jgi:hypothetical protein